MPSVSHLRAEVACLWLLIKGWFTSSCSYSWRKERPAHQVGAAGELGQAVGMGLVSPVLSPLTPASVTGCSALNPFSPHSAHSSVFY